jgi:hypothetical protein
METKMTNPDIKSAATTSEAWPSLPLDEWKDTYATLHMWTQIVGKVKLAHSPPINHWWQTPLYVSPHGLTTSNIPYGQRSFEIIFDFITHQLLIQTSDDTSTSIKLRPQAVADFYSEFMNALRSLDIQTSIYTMPVEIPDPIRFTEDHMHASYDAEYANRLWRILLQSERVMNEFRARFVGKSSPVHFFWGSFDLAVTRFSGRRAPERPEADSITREAYSHEVISAGFWPGSGNIQAPAFYAYAAPEPAGFSSEPIRPASAFYNKETGGFVLLYDDVRQAASPDETLLEFLQSTYEAGATLAKWDRASLER